MIRADPPKKSPASRRGARDHRGGNIPLQARAHAALTSSSATLARGHRCTIALAATSVAFFEAVVVDSGGNNLSGPF
jgi:hypothetical protein